MDRLKIKKILVPVDFSGCSQEALDYAGSVAQWFGAEVILLHVIESLVYGVDLTLIQPGEASEPRKKLSEMIQHGIDQLKDLGIRAEGLFVNGLPSSEIIKAAEKHQADLIVIGTHGRTGLAHVLLGSTAERVIQRAPCPVMTIKGSRRFREVEIEEGAPPAQLEIPEAEGTTFCHLCAKPSQDVICETCKTRVQAEAFEQKQRVEKEGRIETGRR